LMFGGTDWDSTPERYREPNAMSIRIALRMANEMACLAVPQDFAINDPMSRHLFRRVDADATPEAGNEREIRAQLRRLHRLLLNEELEDGDSELEATWQLWSGSYAAAGADSSRRLRNCDAEASYTPQQTPYPTATHNAIDARTPSVQAWMAVVAYLLSDGRFFLQ
ncbi:MAG: hypothetical protein OXU20_02515, partial [Myxococcales bacterium]|nr:hypothetical protein [Myxococcales bacterium]